MNAWLNRMPMGDESLPVAGLIVAPRLAPRWLSTTKPTASKIQNGMATRKPMTMPTKTSLTTISAISIVPRSIAA
ncbi:hypothetical protein D3C72_1877170 [compost metagenome]